MTYLEQDHTARNVLIVITIFTIVTILFVFFSLVEQARNIVSDYNCMDIHAFRTLIGGNIFNFVLDERSLELGC